MSTEIEQNEPIDSLAQRLKSMRLSMEINQRELARRAGVSHSLLNLLESGKRRTVSFDAGAKIAATLGVRLAWLRCEPGAIKERPTGAHKMLTFRDMANMPKDWGPGELELQNAILEEDAMDDAGSEQAYVARIRLSNSLKEAATILGSLSPDQRETVLELFALMVEHPEQMVSLAGAIEAIAK